jgi:hypothetical protein
MDNAYYEDLAGLLYGLVIRLAGRLPSDEARWLHHVVEVGVRAEPIMMMDQDMAARRSFTICAASSAWLRSGTAGGQG